MYHQWFNSVQYGKKEKALIDAIQALGSKPIKYGEQPDYEQKMLKLKSLFDEYVEFCENGHKQLKEQQDECQEQIVLK